MHFLKMVQKNDFDQKAVMTMALENSKQSTKHYRNHLGMFGIHTHHRTINCIQSCCFIHMLSFTCYACAMPFW